MAVWLYYSFQRDTNQVKKIKMNVLLDRLYEDIQLTVKKHFKGYIVKVSELKSSFFVLIKRYRGKVLRERWKFLFDTLKLKTEDIYRDYASKSKNFEQEYFPYFKLVKSYVNYQFHFLVKERLCKKWKIITIIFK